MKLNKSIYKYQTAFLLMLFSYTQFMTAQPVPGVDENIPFLITFGKDGKTSWGDNMFHSVWFYLVPTDFKKPFYIRVFDPECGGENDEIQGDFNSRTAFSVYGGAGVDPDKNLDSRGDEKGLNYKKGNLLASRVFGKEPQFDNKPYTFGPFNPTDGDFSTKWNRYVFKIVVEGIAGDDGNLYKFYFSSDQNRDAPIEGANAFTYKYIFRMWNNFKSVAHIYPYIDTSVVSVKSTNFDWDNDGQILVVSTLKEGFPLKVSGEDNDVTTTFPIETGETKASLDFQFHKRQGELVKNNNVVITTKNQFDQSMAYFSSPIGGVPVYITKTGLKKLPPKK
jgi:hypothetical protein